jgi:hypothetical protein
MEACYGGTDVMERSCAVARGIDINMLSLCAMLAPYRMQLNVLTARSSEHYRVWRGLGSISTKCGGTYHLFIIQVPNIGVIFPHSRNFRTTLLRVPSTSTHPQGYRISRSDR